MRKETIYLRQTTDTDRRVIEAEKKRWNQKGYRVVVFVEGKGSIGTDLYEVLKSHHLQKFAESS